MEHRRGLANGRHAHCTPGRPAGRSVALNLRLRAKSARTLAWARTRDSDQPARQGVVARDRTVNALRQPIELRIDSTDHDPRMPWPLHVQPAIVATIQGQHGAAV